MKTILGVAFAVHFLGIAGCQESPQIPSDAAAIEPVSYVKADDLSAILDEESGIVLIEFCVPVGCFRCKEMRNPIEQLANTERERLSIRRVDFNKHASLARQLGVSVCPSYIAFHKGKEVFRAAYPTSSDLIAAGLDAALRSASTE